MAAVKREHVLAAGVLAGAGVLFFIGHNMSGGSRPPKYAGTTEGSWNLDQPYVPIQPDIGAGYRTTCHRYPDRVGHEITTLIQGGHSAASVPRYLPQAYLIAKPPTELVL